MVQNDKSRPRELAGFYSLPPLRGLLHEHFSGRPHKPNRPHVWLTPSARVCTRTSSTKKCRRQLIRLAFRAVAPGGGPARRRLSCPGRSRLATLQLRRRGGRAERRGQVEEGSGAFPRGHAAGGQGTRGQQGWPQGAARGREARCRRSWYRWARSLNQTGVRGAPRTHLRSSGAPVSTVTLLLSVLRS